MIIINYYYKFAKIIRSHIERDANIFHPFSRESSVCVYQTQPQSKIEKIIPLEPKLQDDIMIMIVIISIVIIMI
jgi:hypothetical protein